MSKLRRINNKNIGFASIFTLLALAISIVSAVTSAFYSERYEISVRSVSQQSFKAPREVENEIATENKRREVAESIEPRYAIDLQVKSNIMIKLDNFFDEIARKRMIYSPIVNPTQSNTNENMEISGSDLTIPLNEDQLNYIVTVGTEFYNNFVASVYEITENELDIGIKENDGLTKSLTNVREMFNRKAWDNIAKNLGHAIVQNVLEANFFIDEDATERLRQERASEVEPIVYLEGQTIINAGDIVTEEVYAVLDKLGYTRKSLVENIYPLIGTIATVTVIFSMGALYVFYYNNNEKMLSSKKNILLLFTLYTSGILLSRFLSFAPFPFIPILAIAMLTSILIDARLAIIVCICIAVNAAVSVNSDIKFIIYFLINGIFVSVIGKYTTERNKIFSISLLVSFFNAFVMCAIYFLFDQRYTVEMRDMLVYAALSGVSTVIICIGTLPFWEAVFGVITPIKLLEITNPNNKLLRRLIIEAPGTYHHSLIVANLAETGAYDIGANSALARAGGFYHDIGKLKYPQYFVENQAGENPHNYMDPYSSAQVIVGHVMAGLELADTYKLPKVIRDFIEMHHGNTMIKYFYIKAKNDDPSADIKEEDFRYPHLRPDSKETAVVMLADTVEAAVRSMIPTGKTMLEVESFVRTLIKDKLNDDQLINSNLTINDLDTLVGSFMRVFKGMYHERIPYPKMEKPVAK